MIEKIISGGQTGADQGGLEAGKILGLKTGGTAPMRFLTEGGSLKGLLESFELVEGEYDLKTYPKRTKKNVVDSDGTLLVGFMDSAGSKLTLRYCNELKRPWVVNPTPGVFNRWIRLNNIVVLNVAGNRESKNPGIQERVKCFLVSALKEQ